MKLYVSPTWVKEMNEDGCTRFYTEDGTQIDAGVTICEEHSASPTEPMLYNLFGVGDHFALTRVYTDCNGDMEIVWKVDDDGWKNYVTFEILRAKEERTSWGVDE